MNQLACLLLFASAATTSANDDHRSFLFTSNYLKNCKFAKWADSLKAPFQFHKSILIINTFFNKRAFLL